MEGKTEGSGGRDRREWRERQRGVEGEIEGSGERERERERGME